MLLSCGVWLFLCFKQKTAYEWRIRDWSSDVCSSDLSLRQVDEAGNVEIEVVEDVPLQLDARGVLGGARQRTRSRGIPGTGQAEQRHRRIVYRALVIAVRLVVDDRQARRERIGKRHVAAAAQLDNVEDPVTREHIRTKKLTRPTMEGIVVTHSH